MPQIINTNIASLNAQRNLNESQRDANVAFERLSSGLRINSAKDDAAGLAISTRFQSQISGLNVAQRKEAELSMWVSITFLAGVTACDLVYRALEHRAPRVCSDFLFVPVAVSPSPPPPCAVFRLLPFPFFATHLPNSVSCSPLLLAP